MNDATDGCFFLQIVEIGISSTFKLNDCGYEFLIVKLDTRE